MTHSQILHALKIVDDVHRIKRSQPGEVVMVKSSIKDVVRATPPK